MPTEYYFLLGGCVLLLVEFALPGFGAFGISGILCLTIGSFFLLGGGPGAIAIIGCIYLVLALLVALCCCYLPKESKYNPFVLWEKQRGEKGYRSSPDLTALVGRQGLALTPLRPAGTISIAEERLDALTLGDFIQKGERVQVLRVEGSKVFVKKVKE